MALVKFVKSVRYNRNMYPAHTPFEVKDSEVALLRMQGAIVLSSSGIELEKISDPSDKEEMIDEKKDESLTGPTKEELLQYTLAQLNEFAEERGIDLKGKTKKAEVYNIIVSAL